MASTVSDLVSQYNGIDDNDIAIAVAASTAVMDPFDDTDSKLRISSIVAQDDGSDGTIHYVTRSDAYNGETAYGRCDAFTMPSSASNMIGNDESVVMAEVDFQHTLILGDLTIRNFSGGKDYIQGDHSGRD